MNSTLLVALTMLLGYIIGRIAEGIIMWIWFDRKSESKELEPEKSEPEDTPTDSNNLQGGENDGNNSSEGSSST